MERLTGKQTQTLVEAYAAVYTPQELTEEQVWEGVEEWVNALLEEGYDLSDYTWEEMYEAYLSEAVPKPSPVTKPGTPPSSLTTKPADDKAANMAAFAKANPKLAAAAAERARIRGTSQSDNPLMRDMPGKRPMTPSVQSPTLAKDLGNGSGNQSLVNNPNASKAAATPAAGNTLSQTVTAASKPTAFSPTPAAGNTLSQTVTAASKPTAFSPTPAATPATPATPKPSLQDKIKAQRGISSSFDVFDVIKGHLLDEGYADTEEAALAIMANMSEEWRQSIVEDFPNVLNFAGQGGSRSGDAGTRGLKMIQTPGGQRGYINKHSGGEILPSGTVNKIMGGNLMVKNKNPKSNIQTA